MPWCDEYEGPLCGSTTNPVALKVEEVGDFEVSTVTIAEPYFTLDGHITHETMVFKKGTTMDLFHERYVSEAYALKGHAKIVETLKATGSLDDLW